jgi:hypothetical protein
MDLAPSAKLKAQREKKQAQSVKLKAQRKGVERSGKRLPPAELEAESA